MVLKELQGLRDWVAQDIMKFKPFLRGTQWGWIEGTLDRFPTSDDLFIPWEDFRPDDPTTGQTWMLVERMRELGFWLNFIGNELDILLCHASFNKDGKCYDATDDNPCLAILKAAKATEAK